MEFEIYKIMLSQAQQKSLYAKADGSLLVDHAQEYLGKLFEGNQLNIYKQKEKGDPIIYPNDILAKRKDVMVLRLNNIQSKTLIKPVEKNANGVTKYEPVKEISNPYNFIIIDNRDGICQMAIERNSAWGKHTDKVRDILQESLSRLLRDNFNLDISIEAKMQPTNIWDLVNERLDKGDEVSRIAFSFRNRLTSAPIEEPRDISPRVKAAIEMGEIMRALKTRLSFDGAPKGSMDVSETCEDIASMARLCSSNAYELDINFRNFGLYRCNENITATFEPQEGIITDFINGDMIHYGESKNLFDLLNWLDFIREQTKELNHAPASIKRSKNNRR